MKALRAETAELCALFSRGGRWLICVNADPDALGAAMALRRIAAKRGAEADVAAINEVRRPDNLAMIRFLRIPLLRLTPELAAGYQRFAMVDSQPSHSPAFAGLSFDVIIDHHPVNPEHPPRAAFARVRPDYGSTSAMLTEYLRALKIRPGKLLATALMYGVKTDTASFEGQFSDADVRAFGFLSRHASKPLLRKIAHSEYKKEWLKYFSRAFRKLRFVGRKGLFVFMGRLESPDILVILADFFTRAHGLSHVAVAGMCEERAVVIFRSDGLGARHMGEAAARLFGDVGSAGGRKSAARAEIDLKALAGREAEEFLYKRIAGKPLPKRPLRLP